MTLLNLVIAFNLGVFSTLHCLGMCGGIAGALSLAIPGDVNKSPYQRIKITTGYNLGRITSYTIAGAIAGASAGVVVPLLNPAFAHRLLQFLAAVILVLIGLNLAGWLPLSGRLEGIGFRLWRYIQPFTRKFVPITGFFPAFKTGMVWGWLPCALVYSVLLWSLASGSVISGGLQMFVFGLGTLPGMITAGSLGSSLRETFTRPAIRRIAAIIIICFGLASPFLPAQHNQVHSLHKMENSSIPGVDHHPSGYHVRVFPDRHIVLI